MKASLAAVRTRLQTWHVMRWLVGAGAGAGAALLFGAASAFAWDGQPGGDGSANHRPTQQIAQKQAAAQFQSNRQNGASLVSANAANVNVWGSQNNQAGTFQSSSQRQGIGQLQAASVDPPALSQRQGAAQFQSNRQNGASLVSANAANVNVWGNQNNQAGTFQSSSQRQGIGQLQAASVDPPALSQRQGAAQFQSNRQNGFSGINANAANVNVGGSQNNQAGTFQSSSQRQGIGQLQATSLDPPSDSQRQGAAQGQSSTQNGFSGLSANALNFDFGGSQNNQAGTFQSSSQRQRVGQLQIA